MIEWAAKQSEELMATEREALREQQAADAAAASKNSTRDEHQRKQKEEIDRLLNALKSAKQNIAGGAAAQEPAQPSTQPAGGVPSGNKESPHTRPIHAVAAPEGQAAQSIANTSTPTKTPKTPKTPNRPTRSSAGSPARASSPRKDPLQAGAVDTDGKQALVDKYKVAAERRKKKDEERRIKAQREQDEANERLQKEAERKYAQKKKEASDRRERQKKLEQAVVARRSKLAEERQAKAEAVRAQKVKNKVQSGRIPISSSSSSSSRVTPTQGARAKKRLDTPKLTSPALSKIKFRQQTGTPSRLPVSSTPSSAKSRKITRKPTTEMQTLEDEYIRVMQGKAATGFGSEGENDLQSPGGTMEMRLPAPAHAIVESGPGGPGTPTGKTDKSKGVDEVINGIVVKARVCRVKRQPSKGLGVEIESHMKTSTWVKVRSVQPSGPFEKAGVRPGDIFIRVNEHLVVNRTHSRVVELLKKAPGMFNIVVSNESNLSGADEASAPPTPTPDSAGLTPEPAATPPKMAGSAPPPQRMAGTLRRDADKGLGLVLYTDRSSNTCVQMVEPSGGAAQAGLQVGDVFVQIGGMNVQQLGHQEVVAALQDCGDTIEFVADKGAQHAGPQDAASALPKHDKLNWFTVQRPEANAPLGIALQSQKGLRGVRLTLVEPGKPFGVAGVEQGQVFVEIDGLNVLDLSHRDVTEALQCAGSSIRVATASADSVASLGDAAPATPVARQVDGLVLGGQVVTNGGLKLRKCEVERIPSKGLGIELLSMRNKKHIGVRCKTIDIAGPMAFAGVREGDVFVQVNGTPVLNAAHIDVINAFKAADQRFTVVVVASEELDAQLRSPAKDAAAADKAARSRLRAKQAAPVQKPAAPLSPPQPAYPRVTTDMGKSTPNDLMSARVIGTETEMRNWGTDDMENSLGWQALKKAQQEANLLMAVRVSPCPPAMCWCPVRVVCVLPVAAPWRPHATTFGRARALGVSAQRVFVCLGPT